MKKTLFIAGLLLTAVLNKSYSQGLQGIVVEKYYSANAADVADATAELAVTPLTVGSTTYRVYVDMAAGYKFSQLYGTPAHNLTISSTANFFNDPNYGVSIDPGTVSVVNIRKNTAMIDSWLTTGGVATSNVGCLKSEDTNGALGNTDGLLANNPGSCYGFPISGSGSLDGFLPSTVTTYLAPNTLGLGSALDVLDQTAGSSITITNGAVAALGGIVGPTTSNMVLIGQFTTSGSLSFALNVQLINTATGEPENYVSSSPGSGELTHPTLVQTVTGSCPSSGNDSPNGATLVSYSPNINYPNCYPINGNTSSSSDSPESSSTGPDTWYRFVAQSSAASITLSSLTMDDVIELYQKVGPNYVLMPGGVENASSGIGDFERLNYTGLTPGTTYYISVGAASGTTGGAFTLCIQNLMPSGCSYSVPVGGFGLCNNYKAIYRGAPAQGVTYDFSFTGIGGGASGTTSVSGTNGLITLSNPSLALRYGGIYNVQVNTNYALQNSAGATENITVNGTVAGNCSNVSISSQPNVEVRVDQRCPSSLLRSNYLVGKPVAGSTYPCGAVSYTYEFTAIDACGGVTGGFPNEFTTTLPNPYLGLGVLTANANTGAWRVRIRPNFSYGNGTYGPAQDIQVANTAASSMVVDNSISNENIKTDVEMITRAAIYPNPSTGDIININLTDVEESSVFVKIINQMGQLIYNNQFVVDGNLNTSINFDSQLASGLYMVEFHIGNNVMTERLIVQK